MLLCYEEEEISLLGGCCIFLEIRIQFNEIEFLKQQSVELSIEISCINLIEN